MAYPVLDKFRRRYFTVTMADVSATSSVVYVTMPCRGRVIRAYCTISGAISGADNALTATINGTAITGMSATMANAGSGAGSTTTLADATGANNFVDGDYVGLLSDGGSSTTALGYWTLVVETY